ncbi:MAG: hypothetical protein VB035_00685 [Candidatus Fimivivens sp.]|nr:hypothetical protein [Candidatus Fimivivens sp.]
MKNKSHFSIKRVLKAISLLFALLVVGLLIVLCIHQYFGSGSLTSSEIMSFFGGYLGVSLSIMITMMRADEDDKRYEENQSLDKIRHEETLNQISEQKRLDLLPILDISEATKVNRDSITEIYGLNLIGRDYEAPFEFVYGSMQELDELENSGESNYMFFLSIRNVGLGGAINVMLDEPLPQFSIRRDEGRLLAVLVDINDIHKAKAFSGDDDITGEFYVRFQDVTGTCYRQHVQLTVVCLPKNRIYPRVIVTSPPERTPNPSYKTDPSTRQRSEVNQ